MIEKYTKNNSSLLGGIVAIIVGLVMIIWSDRVLNLGIKLIGIVAIVIGLVQFVGFLSRPRKTANRWAYLPIAAPIAVVWGTLLLLNPELWKNLFVILVGVLLIFLGLYQLVSMYKIKKSGVKVSGIYFFFSILLMMSGIFVAAQPTYTASWFITFIGAWILAYGVVELFGYFSLRGPIEDHSASPDKQIEVEDKTQSVEE